MFLQKPITFLRAPLGALAVAALAALPIAAQTTTRVSLDGTVQTDWAAFTPDISADGTRIAFGMIRSNMSGPFDIWVYDTVTQECTDVTPGDSMNSYGPSLSDDGTQITYSSPNHLIPGMPQSGANAKLYLEDIASGALTLISWTPSGGSTGGQYAKMSTDVRHVTFESNSGDLTDPGVTPFVWQVYARDLVTATNTLITRSLSGTGGNGQSRFPDISGDGRWVVFESVASDLVAGVSGAQVYVRDRDPDEDGVFDEGNGVTRLLSQNAAGVPGDFGSSWPSISEDGRYVSYQSSARNLISNDINGTPDVFVLDRDFDGNGTYDDSPAHNTCASVDSLGNQVSSSWWGYPQLSGDGQKVLFASWTADLVANATPLLHIYLHDLTTGQTTCVSVDSDYNFGNNMSGHQAGTWGPGILAIDRYGDRVVYVSTATNLVPGDTNDVNDVFMHEVPDNPAVEMGSSLAGSGGIAPDFTAYGGPPYVLRLRRTLPSAKAYLMFSHMEGSFALFGGTVIPLRPLVWGPMLTDADGSLDLSVNRRVGHTTLFTQWLVRDPGAAQGWSFSNALQLFPDGLTGGDSPVGRNSGPP